MPTKLRLRKSWPNIRSARYRVLKIAPSNESGNVFGSKKAERQMKQNERKGRAAVLASWLRSTEKKIDEKIQSKSKKKKACRRIIKKKNKKKSGNVSPVCVCVGGFLDQAKVGLI